MPVDYQKGKIYKIVCNTTKEAYIGSTCEPTVARRLAGHRGHYKKWLKDPVKYCYYSSFQILARGNYEILLLESCPCNNKDELRMKEREWFDTIPNINMVKPYVSVEETKDQKKIWSEEHKEERKEQNKIWREEHKEESKEQQKIWREEHKKEIAQKDKIYYQDNKKKISEKNKEKFTCECGSICVIFQKVRHFKTQKHLEYLSNLNVDGLELK